MSIQFDDRRRVLRNNCLEGLFTQSQVLLSSNVDACTVIIRNFKTSLSNKKIKGSICLSKQFKQIFYKTQSLGDSALDGVIFVR